MPKAKRKKKGLPQWTHVPVYYGVRGMITAMQIAGIEPTMRAMRGIGGVWGAAPFNQKRFERAVDNIMWCFPDWDEDRARRYALEAYRHLFMLAAEVSLMPRLLTEDSLGSRVNFDDVSDALSNMLSDRPCLMLTGHCGNWEVMGYTMAVLGFPIHALYRPLDLKPINNWLVETRSRRGLTLVDKFGAARILPRLIEKHVPIGFIADQNAGDRGLMTPFFNRLSSAYKTIGLLAMRFKASIVCGHAVRQGRWSPDAQTFRYRIEIPDVILPEEWEDHPDPLFYITARYRRSIENMVRRAPEQYLWMHRYWKSRPKHERQGKPFPPALRSKLETLPWMTSDDIERVVERSERDARELAAR